MDRRTATKLLAATVVGPTTLGNLPIKVADPCADRHDYKAWPPWKQYPTLLETLANWPTTHRCTRCGKVIDIHKTARRMMEGMERVMRDTFNEEYYDPSPRRRSGVEELLCEKGEIHGIASDCS